tara:strand:- start:7007 stop:8464 length:1458 start_codon:yes stop_codon:yes gene_type:complete
MKFIPLQFIGSDWAAFILFFIAVLILVGISEVVFQRGILTANAIRILVHCTVGTACSLSPFLFISNTPPILLGLFFTMLNTAAMKRKIFKGIHAQERVSYGTVYFPLAYLIMVIFFWDFTHYLVISLSILALADPLATIVGQSASRPLRTRIWEDKKSVQGSAAMFLCSGIIVYGWSWILPSEVTNIDPIYFVLITAGMSTIAEMISFRGSDNLSIPLLSFFTMHCTTIKGPYFEMILLCVIFSFLAAYLAKMITTNGLFGALVMGFLVAGYGNLVYLIPIAIFFILSSVLSKSIPSKTSVIPKGSKRDIVQVYANGSVALLLCIIHGFTDSSPMIFLLFLSSVSAATADTWATEFGKLSKKSPVSIINFQVMTPGLSGGVTRIGTIGSLLGAAVIGLTAHILGVADYGVYGVIGAGFIAGILDSVLGATVQAKYQTGDGQILEYISPGGSLVSGYKWITNDLVNLLNTASAPLIMYIYIQLTGL